MPRRNPTSRKRRAEIAVKKRIKGWKSPEEREQEQYKERPPRRSEERSNMPRKGPVRKRPIIPDPVFNNIMAQRFINRLTLSGKKSIAEKIFYGALEICEKKANAP